MKKFAGRDKRRRPAPTEAQTQKLNVALAVGGISATLAGVIVAAYQAIGLSAAAAELIGWGLVALSGYAIGVPLLGLPFPSPRSEPFWHRSD